MSTQLRKLSNDRAMNRYNAAVAERDEKERLAELDRRVLERLTEEGLGGAFGRIVQPSNESRYAQIIRTINTERIENLQTEVYKFVSRDDLEKLPIDQIVDKLVRSEASLDQIVTVFVTLVTQELELTSDDPFTQSIIDEVIQMLAEKKNPIELFYSHMASSAILRGNICVEAVFDDAGNIENLFATDPKYVEWREVNKGQGIEWAMGQYLNGEWTEIDSTNVYWESVNPIIGKRVGYSQVQTAIPAILDNTAMRSSLHLILDRHAFAKRSLVIKQLEAKRLEFTDTQIKNMTAEAKQAIAQVPFLSANELPYFSDFVEIMNDSGSGSGLSFTDMIDRMDDRKVFRGGKFPPTLGGSNEFVAESSANSQNMFYSTYLTGTQEKIKRCTEWVITKFVRSRGATGDPVLTYKSLDVLTRLEESKAYYEMAKGIKVIVSAGVPLIQAFALYAETTGNELPETIMSDIERDMTEPMAQGDGNADPAPAPTA